MAAGHDGGESPIDIDRLQERISAVETAARNASGKDIVLVLGKSGVGISTMINWLQGRKMEEVIGAAGQYHLRVAEDDTIGDEVASPKISIGGGCGRHVPGIYECGQDYVLVDTAGFLDTGGVEDRLANNIAIHRIIEQASSIKGVVLAHKFSEFDITGCNETLRDCLSMFNDLLPDATVDHSSVVQAFSKVKSLSGYSSAADITSVIDSISDCEAGTHGGGSPEFIANLARMHENPRLIPIQGVGDQEVIVELLRFFAEDAETIPKDKFHFSFPATEKALLQQVVENSAQQFLMIYQRYQEAQANIERCRIEHDRAVDERDSIEPHRANLKTIVDEYKYIKDTSTVRKTTVKKDFVGMHDVKSRTGRVKRSHPIYKTTKITEDVPNPKIPAREANIASLKTSLPSAISSVCISYEGSKAKLDELTGQVDTLNCAIAASGDSMGRSAYDISEQATVLMDNKDKYKMASWAAVQFALDGDGDIARFVRDFAAYCGEPTPAARPAAAFAGAAAAEADPGAGAAAAAGARA